ncbi:MAG: AcrR family transcriptional regulator, partial [Myxococcota bacterium]
MDRRAQRRETRKQEMLDAAMGIVLDEGIEALTIARIAARLDAAVGALYRYFPGKEALIVGL